MIVGSQYDTNHAGATIFLDGRTNPDGSTGVPPSHIHFQIGDGSWHAAYTNTVVPLNQWVQIVATRNANENAMIYYNGVLQPTVSCSICGSWSGAISYTGSEFNIGMQSGLGRYFNGKIADVQIYNASLSAIEIQGLYAEGIGGAPTRLQNLVAWWPLNGDANDYGGNGNKGVQTNVVFISSWTR
jgi:hypothetical protein